MTEVSVHRNSIFGVGESGITSKLFVNVGKVMDHLSVTFYFGSLISKEGQFVLSFTCYQRDALLIFTEMKV